MPTREDDLTLGCAGDAIIMRKIRTFQNEKFRSMVQHVNETDAAVVNLEVLLHDYEGYPTGGKTGTYMRAPKWVADELTWMGFDMFTAATNHTNDYSHEGMESTMRTLEDRNIPFAGLGRNLAEAREPAYLDTPAGRVALVSTCSTTDMHSIAGEQRRDMQGRPGIAPLRNEGRYVIPAEEFQMMKDVAEKLDLGMTKDSFPYWSPKEHDGYYEFENINGEDLKLERGEEFSIIQTADENDVSAALDQIDRARRQADWVIASLHSHEIQGSPRAFASKRAHYPPEFVESFARKCIDAGADAFHGHGAHVLQGIEVYKGAPIFYDLGDFIYQNQLVTRLPTEFYERYNLDPQTAYPEDALDARSFDEDGEPKGILAFEPFWESVLPICEFQDQSLEQVTLYPLDLMQTEPRPRRGRPVIADGEKAIGILNKLSELSEPYDTTISIDDGIGVIEV